MEHPVPVDDEFFFFVEVVSFVLQEHACRHDNKFFCGFFVLQI